MALVEAQDSIRARLRGGASLAQVEREMIDPSPFGEEQRAALWLFAAAMARSESRSTRHYGWASQAGAPPRR
jgi:alkylhydroperoxidase family enzyme